jgi:hypothetical protein
MTEAPSPIFYATARPEARKPESKVVTGVKKALNSWWERIGPKGVEDHFVKAHENVLATLDSEQRKEVFAKELESWRKTGKVFGVAATVIDTSLASLGGFIAFRGWTNLEKAADVYTDSANWLTKITKDTPFEMIQKVLVLPYDEVARSYAKRSDDWKIHITGVSFTDKRAAQVGKAISTIPAIGSLGILLTSGPGHWLAHLAAGGKEQIGKMKAKRQNYVDSGKAAEKRGQAK